jgi:hypothetical protein
MRGVVVPRVLTCLVASLALTGCVVRVSPSDFANEVRRATRQYVNDLADSADRVAEKIATGEVDSNAQAFEEFQSASRAARDRFNTTVGTAFDRRCPPEGEPDAEAWRELARGFRP